MVLRFFKFLVLFCLVGLLLSASVFAWLGGGFGVRQQSRSLLGYGSILFGHRANKTYFAGNTLQAIEYARTVGFQAFEIDIITTKDNKLVLFHDNSGQHLLKINADISTLNWSDIQNKPIWREGDITPNTILTLNDFLKNKHPNEVVYLDIKSGSQQVADSLLQLFELYQCYESVLVADANFLFLSYIKHKNPNVITCLEGFENDNQWAYYLMPQDFKPDYYSSFWFNVDESHLAFLKKNNLMERKILYGVDTTNILKIPELKIGNLILDFDSSMYSLEIIRQQFIE